MTDMVAAAVTALSARLAGRGFDGSALFVIEGAGALRLDGAGVRAVPGAADPAADPGNAAGMPADVTLTADAPTFRDILSGSLGPMQAYMSGRLSIKGDMSAALRLGSVLA